MSNMFIEVLPIKDETVYPSILSNLSVTRCSIKIDGLQQRCIELINSGCISNRCLTILLKTSFGRFDLEKAYPFIKNFIPYWFGFSKQARGFLTNPGRLLFNAIYQNGNQLCGLFPGTLNYKTIIFYHSVLILLSKKFVVYKKLPIKLTTSRAGYYFESWLKMDARKLLDSEHYRLFVNRFSIDILQLERSVIVNNYIVNQKRFPNVQVFN